MAATAEAFQSLLLTMGSDVTYHREEGGVFCPCRTREGFRSPALHNTKAPALALGALGGPTGAVKYKVTFVNAVGEAGTNKESAVVNPVNQAVALTLVPLGPSGTTQRKIYRSRNAGPYGLVTTLANNVATVYTDVTVADPAPAVIPSVCNEKAVLAADVIEFAVRASVQPLRSSNRRAVERIIELFGSIEADDHLGIFPVVWNGDTLNFLEWSEAGEDYILYDGRRFTVVAADKLPDVDGDPDHHWEVALRLLKPEAARPV